MNFFELNMDGLVGPTHHYAGLAHGNMASIHNALTSANPQAAALQGLAKMRLLHELGIKQALLPPHPRPNLHLLYQLGFRGSAIDQVQKAKKQAPELLSACYSAANMWAANVATVSASQDTKDGLVHFTQANQVTYLHRAQEAAVSAELFQKIFAHPDFFNHHPAIPASSSLGDEGAANYSRLCAQHQAPGFHIFVYGRKWAKASLPKIYPARQTLEASQTLARLHQLDERRIRFVCQNPKSIDQGMFHNDVIALINESVFLLHEEAYINQARFLQDLKAEVDFPLHIIQLTSKQLSVKEAVETYLFNSQLITLPDNQGMLLLAPIECEENKKISSLIQNIIEDDSNPIAKVQYINLKQSMKNGGGPACLRLRVPLNSKELAAMHQGVLVSSALLDALEVWVKKYYRDKLEDNDLGDPLLMEESFAALEALMPLIGLPKMVVF